MHIYLACFDISDDKNRDRAGKELLTYGDRVQKSVFEIAIRRPEDFASSWPRCWKTATTSASTACAPTAAASPLAFAANASPNSRQRLWFRHLVNLRTLLGQMLKICYSYLAINRLRAIYRNVCMV